MPVNTHTILLPPITGQVVLDSGSRLDSIVETEDFLILTRFLDLLHRLREHVFQPIHTLSERSDFIPERFAYRLCHCRSAYLKKNQVCICQLASVKPGPVTAGFALQHTLEIAQELGQAIGDVVLALALALLLLILVVQAGSVISGWVARRLPQKLEVTVLTW